MGEASSMHFQLRNAYNTLLTKREGKRQLERSRPRNNITMDLREVE
jgi:hypothetical protein